MMKEVCFGVENSKCQGVSPQKNLLSDTNCTFIHQASIVIRYSLHATLIARLTYPSVGAPLLASLMWIIEF